MKVTVSVDKSLVEKLRRRDFFYNLKATSVATGKRASRAKGQGLEFYGYSQFTQGDSLKFVDWKLYSRTGKLYSKNFHEEKRLTVAIYLDLSDSMLYDFEKIQAAWQIVCAFTYIGILNRDKVLLRLNEFQVIDSLAKARFLLSEYELSSKKNSESELSRFLSFLRIPSIFVWISDFLDPLDEQEKIVKLLSSQSAKIFLIQVLSKKEIFPELKKSVLVVDPENINERKIAGPSSLEDFKLNFRTHQRKLQELCRSYRIDLVTLDNPLGVKDFILKYCPKIRYG